MQSSVENGMTQLEHGQMDEGHVLAELQLLGMASATATLPLLTSDMMVWRSKDLAGLTEVELITGLKVRVGNDWGCLQGTLPQCRAVTH